MAAVGKGSHFLQKNPQQNFLATGLCSITQHKTLVICTAIVWIALPAAVVLKYHLALIATLLLGTKWKLTVHGLYRKHGKIHWVKLLRFHGFQEYCKSFSVNISISL